MTRPDDEDWSGQLDSNQRPAVPKTAALPGCAIPRSLKRDVRSSRPSLLLRMIFRRTGVHFSGPCVGMGRRYTLATPSARRRGTDRGAVLAACSR